MNRARSRKYLYLFVFTCLLILLFQSNSFSSEIVGPDISGAYQVISDSYSFLITVNNTDPYPGAIIQANKYGSEIYEMPNLNLFAPVFKNNLVLSKSEVLGHFLLNDSTLQINLHGTSDLNLEDLYITQIWHAHENSLALDVTYVSSDTVHVRNDAGLILEGDAFSSLEFMNTAGTDEYLFSETPEFELCTQNCYSVASEDLAICFDVKNPFYGNVVRDQSGLRLDVMRTSMSNATIPDLVHSILVPGHQIKRSYLISLEERSTAFFTYDDLIISPSPHADGGTGTIIWASDDLPLRSNWIPPTTSDNPDTPIKSMILRLLESIPRLKLGFVIVYDKLMSFWPYYADVTGGWYMNRGNFAYTEFDYYSGNRSLRMEVRSDTTMKLWQNKYLLNDEQVSFSAFIKIPENLEGDGGLRFRLLSEELGFDYSSPLFHDQNQNWYSVAWTCPEPIPENNYFRVTVEFIDAGGSVFIDDIQISTQSRMIDMENPGFEEGETEVFYTSDEYSFWDAHGPMRISQFATDEYLDFLHRVEDGDDYYGWESQLFLGIHSYHHAQKGDFVGASPPDNQGEWDQDDPSIHSRVFDAIFEDADSMNMRSSSLKFIRTSGINYKHQTLQAALEKSITHFDQGYSGNIGKLYPIYGHENEIWMHGLNQWMDNPASGWSNPEATYELLDHGNICLWGWHPAIGLDGANEERFTWISSIINNLNSEFPNLIWDSPQEVNTRHQIFNNWNNIRKVRNENNINYSFSGGAASGMSLVFYLSDNFTMPDQVLLDGSVELPVSGHHPRFFVTLPDLFPFDHDINFDLVDLNPETEKRPVDPLLKLWPIPSNGYVNVTWQDQMLSGEVNVSIYNTIGQLVRSEVWRASNNKVNNAVTMDNLASGTYFLKLEQKQNNLLKMNKIILIK